MITKKYEIEDQTETALRLRKNERYRYYYDNHEVYIISKNMSWSKIKKNVKMGKVTMIITEKSFCSKNEYTT